MFKKVLIKHKAKTNEKQTTKQTKSVYKNFFKKNCAK